MSTWLQNSDFTSIDIDHLVDYPAFEHFMHRFDTRKLDSLMQRSAETNDDWCPWGIGINMDTGYGMHICREDVEADTYFVTVQIFKKQKALGFIPVTKDHGCTKDGLTFGDMKLEVMKYYEGDKNGQS